MAARKRRARDAVTKAGSWLALLAATTLGSEVAAVAVHAQVRAAGALPGQAYRLIVQSYDAAASDLQSGRAKPVGSTQRVVSGEELRDGIRVDFVELREGDRAERNGFARPLVVAWLEAVQRDYDLDAREARPQPGSVFGFARRATGDVKIRLDRRA
jgi:hypothetical protein